ncbi:MAG: HlyC/CorC family transporter [Tissierellia bacterium]|nr:HlyC/CorC family transporter [Tissierellia bacterium]
MGIDPVPQSIVALVSLFLSAFFTLLKYSYEDLNKFRLEKMKEEKIITESQAFKLNQFIEDISSIQSTFMIFDYLSNAFFAVSFSRIGYHFFGTGGIIAAVVIGTILILVFGESAPYFVSITKGDIVAIKFYKFSRIFTKVASPLTLFIRFISRAIGSLFGLEMDSKEPKITEDELFTAMNLSKDEGLLDVEEFGMIEKVVAFRDSFVKDVMTPRTDVIAVDIDSSIEEIIELFNEEGFSRVPVYEEDIDNLLGILHIKDLLPHFVGHEVIDLKEVVRKPIYTFEYQKTADLFEQMRNNNGTFAIVLDEYGGTEGIVTMEDLIEEIVGEIEDEYDDDSESDGILVLKNNVFIIDGMVRLDEVKEEIDLDLESDEVDTIGGFVVEVFDKIPEHGEVLEYKNLEFTVLEIEKNRVSKLRVTVKENKKEEEQKESTDI